ncbi:hypothetical protein OE88DRAFT_1658973 [Heliocybe sulcata]|uniref:RING-type E3 ubiquitin transferase n=1 Tax=Heliocybe sulcata TaxID=5364 RepID=A0A5C3N2C0_9AGAM|nr:hypothetical protein OE88DRAFT_1658973 [Heliocybe sulcata]
MQLPKRLRLDGSRSPSVEEIPRPPSEHEIEDEPEGEHCSICLQSFEDRTVIPTCSHEFCFECLLVWTEQSRRCPLCTQPLGDYLIHKLRSKYDYQKHYLPPLRSTSPAPLRALSPRRSAAVRRTVRREREWGRRARREREEADAFERAISRRRWLYEHDLYAKHVASNPYTRYRPHPTPAQFSASPDLQSRASIFVRRELRIWPNLDVEFLTTFIISLMKSIDIRSESSIKLLAEFLDMGQPYVTGGRYRNAEHFAHEVYSYIRSPYRDLAVYDTVVQYDSPEDVPLPPQDEPQHGSRWRPSLSRSRSRSPDENIAEPATSRRHGSPSRVRTLERRISSRVVDTGPSEAPGRRRSRSRTREPTAGRKRSYAETTGSSGRHRQEIERDRTPVARGEFPRMNRHSTDRTSRELSKNDRDPPIPKRKDKGKAKEPDNGYIDLTGSASERTPTPPVHDVVPEATGIVRDEAEIAPTMEFPTKSTPPSQVPSADEQTSVDANLIPGHATEGGTSASTGSQRRSGVHLRPRLNLRDSVHAHLTGRSRRPREAAQIQSAHLLQDPSMGISSTSRDVHEHTEIASSSLLTRITEREASSSLDVTQAYKPPAIGDDSTLHAPLDEMPSASSNERSTSLNPIVSSTSPNSGGPGDFRNRLLRKLAEEKQRILSGTRSQSPPPETLIEVDAATHNFAGNARSHGRPQPSDDHPSETLHEANVDTVAAEAKLRSQARVRARLAVAKKGMTDSQG